MPRFQTNGNRIPEGGSQARVFKNFFSADFNMQPRLKTTVLAGLLDIAAVLLHSLLSPAPSLLTLQKTYGDPGCGLGHTI